MKRSFIATSLVLVLVAPLALADPVAQLDYQGKVLVSDIPLTGLGYFKFALTDYANTSNYWANDGTGTGEPVSPQTNVVYNGVFSTILGEAATMTAMDPDIFSAGVDLYLRVWFSSDGTTFNEMLPQQKLVSTPYALNADQLDGMHAWEIIAAASNVTLSGDISGTPAGGTTVDALQGDPLDTGTPSADDVLIWDGTAWTSAPITGVTAGLYVDESGDTMTGALTINATNGLRIDSASNEVAIGRSAQAQTDGTAIGALADGGGSGAAVGMQANASGSGAAVGFSALASDGGAALGRQAEGQRYGAAAGYIAKGSYYGAALGNAADGTNYGAALGYQASGSGTGVAVGASANGAYLGVAVGYGAMGYSDSVAVGANANGTTDGAAVGYDARGYNSGAAVGYQSDGYGSGAALGYQASGMSSGVAVGAEANSGVYGVGVGYRAQAILGGVAVGARSYADYHGVAVGRYASGADTNVAIGYHANSRNGQERISIGHNVTNDMDDTARLRGHLYMDGGMSLWGRTPFGSGIWQQLVPLPDLMNVVWVATNGTPGGPGTIDRPYDAPQAGYNAAAARYTNEPAALVIAAGRFPGLNMTAGNIHVLGFSRPQLQSLTVSSASANILGKQRVENIIFDGVAVVAVDMGSDVKFHNCRFQKGLQILGSRVEVQDCYATGSDGPAVTVGNGTSPISEIAIYNSSMFNKDSANPALLVNNHVYYFEVIACEIVNFDPTPGVMPAWAAIEDQASALHPNEPPHLYSHNIIRGAEHGGAIPPAVYDPFATNLQPTITFVQNTVWGDVGMLSNRQFFANNTVYGQINNVGGPIGWSQAGIGSGNDPAGNTEHQGIYPQWGAVPPGRGFPAAWQD